VSSKDGFALLALPPSPYLIASLLGATVGYLGFRPAIYTNHRLRLMRHPFGGFSSRRAKSAIFARAALPEDYKIHEPCQHIDITLIKIPVENYPQSWGYKNTTRYKQGW
jgi:hypothetical protein